MRKYQMAEMLTKFFADCFKFWLREGKDVATAKELALKDVKGLNNNPYSPNGEELDVELKDVVIEVLEDAIEQLGQVH